MEPHEVGSFVHVVKRGARGMPITRDEADKRRFVKLLYYLNDEHRSDFWERDICDLGMFERPAVWPERRPLVKVLAWTLMPNHFHLLLKETQERGVARFMQSVCGSMSRYFNEKYSERGSIFQGAYRSRTVETDRHLRYVVPYIVVKNVFELYPGGYVTAAKNFNEAWKWAVDTYPFSSLKEYAGENSIYAAVVEKDILAEIFCSPADFRTNAQDLIFGRVPELSSLAILE